MTNSDDTYAKKLEQALLLLRENSWKKDEVEFETIGSCMEPVFFQGDFLVVRRVYSPKSLQIGDILIYQVSAGFRAHRDLYTRRKKGEETLIIKSDNAVGPCAEEISFSQIFGKVVCIRRHDSCVRLDTFPGCTANVCIGFFVLTHLIAMRLARHAIIFKCRITERTIIPGFWQIIAQPLVVTKKAIVKIFLKK